MNAAYNFDAHYSTPGMGAVAEIVEAPTGMKWGKPHPLQWLPARISGAARDAGNTGYTTVLRPGLLLGTIAATGLMKQWDPTAIDGSHKISGVLPFALPVTQSGTDTERFISVVAGGSIVERGLAIASSTSWGIDGHAEEYNIRSQMTPGFVFDDDPMHALTSWREGGIMIIAASATLSEVHNGTLIVVRGASGAVNLTLPATPKKGLRYRVFNAVDQNLTLTAGTADTMVTLADLTADSVALSTSSEKIGGSFEVIGDGTGWLVIPSLWEGQTPTIVTA